MSIDASAYVRRTPRQRAQAAARYDREARETIAAYEARRSAENAARALARARSVVERWTPVLLRGTVGPDRRPITQSERCAILETLDTAWGRLRDSLFLEVLPTRPVRRATSRRLSQADQLRAYEAGRAS